MDDWLKAVELGKPSDFFHTINHVTMAEKEPGFDFPVDAPKCCQHHVSRDEMEKRHEMKNKALYLTRGQLPAGHTKGTNYFTGCRPVETKPVQCTNTN